MTNKYSSMDDVGTMASEPTLAYGNEISDGLPLDIVRKAARCAIDDESNGNLMAHDEAMDWIERKMGWK